MQVRRSAWVAAAFFTVLLAQAGEAEAERPPKTSGGYMGFDVGGAFFLDKAHTEALKDDAPNFGLHFGYELPFGLAPNMYVEYAPLKVDGIPGGRSGHYGSVMFGARYVYRWRWVAPYVGLNFGFTLFGLSGGYPSQGNPSYNVSTHVSWGADFRIANNFWIGPQFRYGHMVASGDQVNSTLLLSSGATSVKGDRDHRNIDAMYVLFTTQLYF